MRSITVAEAERRFRALLDEARGGARLSIVEGARAVARLSPPPPREDAREFAYLRLKRRLSRRFSVCGPRLWTRGALYRDPPGR